jgi:SAM-dependent methyltransferase
MAGPKTDLVADVAAYYTSAIERHGATPRGVDWNGAESQATRFEQLSKIISADTFSIGDLGCGYGAYHGYLAGRFADFTYHGYDVSEAMVAAARQYLPDENVHLHVASTPDRISDYGVASGIFNVRLGRNSDEWRAYVEKTLDALNATSKLGFSFNCLTTYSDAEKMQPDLYYADPLWLFDLCKRRYSRQVALLHDYGLWEFTILVRKDI